MPNYSALGFRIESRLYLTGLRAAFGEHGEVVRILAGAVPTHHPTELRIGGDPTPPCLVRLYALADGYRFEHECTGRYAVSADGSQIIADLVPDVSNDSVRLDVLGRLLPLAMHIRGQLCLHASAVSIAERVIAFVAPKGTGKSTLALALVNQGATTFADDALRVWLDAQPTVTPGIRNIRVQPDVRARSRAAGWMSSVAIDGKFVLESETVDEDERPRELDAIYVLSTAAADADAPVARTRLSHRDALLVVLGQGKLGSLLGGSETATQIDRAMILVSKVPVYSAAIARDLGRVDDVAMKFLKWHGVGSTESA